jgi:DNA-binding LytR/AlgR family response regulator
LMRFSDALAELDGLAGLQVHRSHWVAGCAVVEMKKQNGRCVVVLQNGTEVPVSRAYQKAAKLKFC